MLVERVRRAVQRIEDAEVLDSVVEPVRNAGGTVTGASAGLKNLLSGTWMGHRLHPLMTDAVIGPWLSAYLVDLAGGKGSERAADRLVAIGVATSVPTAVAGMSDWSDTAEPAQHRTGFVHAAANVVALGFQVASLVERRRGDRRRAVVCSTAAMAALGVGGWLGGHLSYVQGAGVDHPTGALPTGWRPALPVDDLADDRPVGVTVDGVDVVLVQRTGGAVEAFAGTCTHAGGPLADGRLDDGCVTCPWHGSRFRTVDGRLVRGPATTPQPSYETRRRDGRVEVRATR